MGVRGESRRPTVVETMAFRALAAPRWGIPTCGDLVCRTTLQ
jgi:hypothetical protein